MKQLTPIPPPDTAWKAELAAALRTAPQLAAAGWIAPAEVPAYERLLERFPLVLPPYYARLIDRTDPRCPIRLQAIPQLRELEDNENREADPLEDFGHRPAPRITHRYAGRALLHLTPNCSMVCRYCFRKSVLSEGKREFFEGEVAQALDYLRRTPGIAEVIFSGGDPFLANETLLGETLAALGEMAHLKRVRFHSRVPVTLPMRVTPAFARLLTRSGKAASVVCHFNHPREITPEATQALAELRAQNLTVLNQSVLLAGVNDSAETLADLSEKLFAAGALPYYLHQMDPAQGTRAFDVPVERGQEIVRDLRERLPGYLVPRYVVDDPARPFKQPLA